MDFQEKINERMRKNQLARGIAAGDPSALLKTAIDFLADGKKDRSVVLFKQLYDQNFPGGAAGLIASDLEINSVSGEAEIFSKANDSVNESHSLGIFPCITFTVLNKSVFPKLITLLLEERDANNPDEVIANFESGASLKVFMGEVSPHVPVERKQNRFLYKQQPNVYLVGYIVADPVNDLDRVTILLKNKRLVLTGKTSMMSLMKKSLHLD